ncbi:hypothetical protein [Methylobacterium sp. SI9]|uniref:hypothetical protein n=1 Tax=Methylobacterium guangdongense TaxID=3138811 RepID=UPI00313C3901
MTFIMAVCFVIILQISWRSFRNRLAVKLHLPLPTHKGPKGWDALRGVLPGAIVGALIYPIIPIVSVYAYALIFRDQQLFAITSPANSEIESFFGILALFIIMIFCWSIAIAMSIQIWSLICWRRVQNIWVAIILGAVLAFLITFISSGFEFASHDRVITDLLMGLAGGASGATVWWSTYRKSTSSYIK